MRLREGKRARFQAPGEPREGRIMRMAELAMESGVARETIHFYLREGLLPRPRKGGKTVAYYGEEHLLRLRTIRRLREEKYLPLSVIRGLLESPAAAAERDVDTLAEVLHIVPDAREIGLGPLPSARALSEATARALLGPPREGEPGGAGAAARDGRSDDSAERRLLQLIEEAIALDPAAQRLTLDDLQACAADLTGLVKREAQLFFEALLSSADVSGTIAALRSGRSIVARFITAYRDLMLRRVVEGLLAAVQRGPEVAARTAVVPLSPSKEGQLGMLERRAALASAVREAPLDSADATRLVWHLFACGAAAELAALPAATVALAGPRCRIAVAWGAYESHRSEATLKDLEQALERAPDMALGQILAGEARFVRGLSRRDAERSLIEQAVPALHRVVCADPERDPEPVAQVLGHYHKGRIEVALPPVFGRGPCGARALARALALVETEASAAEIDPVLAARIAGNARLMLARHAAISGDRPLARSLLAAALAVDPEGPIGSMAREQIAALAG